MQNIDEIEKRLKRAGALKPDDLPFNQLGELSERQRRWLMLEIVGWSIQIGLEVLLIIVIWGFYFAQFQFNAQAFWWVGGLFWTVVIGGAIVVCVENIQPIRADLAKNEVRSLVGPISKSMSFQRGRSRAHFTNWNIGIKDYQFSAFPFVYYSLVEGQSYRIFYTPTLQRIMNVEPALKSDSEK